MARAAALSRRAPRGDFAGPDLRAALALLRPTDEPAPATLRAAGFASLDALARFVADELQLARLELDAIDLSLGLARLVPQAAAERYLLVPVFASDDELTVATCDPAQLEILDWLGQELGRRIVTVVSTGPEIARGLRRVYERRIVEAAARDADAEPEVRPEDLVEAAEILDRLIADAVQLGASDIHVEASETESAVRFRVDGSLRKVLARPLETHGALVSRIKVLAELDIAERQAPQDGRLKLRRAGGDVELRVSVLPTLFGEKVCCRILDNGRACLPLGQLGFDADDLELFHRLITVPYGLVLVTGPTGSGKSTTLYSALNAVRSPEINVVTVEDPVEYRIPGINQVQVNPKRGLTFAGALRSILRQDPDVVLVGEIRDRETGMIAAEAALTGHLVLSSLHTNDATSAVTRLLEMGLEPFLLAPALVGVVAQRLVRKTCGACAEEYTATAAELKVLGVAALPDGTRLRRGRGCAACGGTGYRGRTAIHEVLEATPAIKAGILRGTGADELRVEAAAAGFRTMRLQALRKLFTGVTTSQEVVRLTR
jgi:type IV pilus assembly protein PilB